MSERTGIFGGTFDPAHIGHLILADEASWRLKLDRILWVLTPNPPHKKRQILTPLEYRFEMVQAAIEGNPMFEISRVDIDRPPPHYAVDTVRILSGQYRNSQLVYLMGGDSLRDLSTWHHPQEFIQACDGIGVMRRPGDQVDLVTIEQRFPGLVRKVAWVEAPLLEIASSDIRQRITDGRSYRYYLPPGVVEIIRKQSLYRD